MKKKNVEARAKINAIKSKWPEATGWFRERERERTKELLGNSGVMEFRRGGKSAVHIHHSLFSLMMMIMNIMTTARPSFRFARWDGHHDTWSSQLRADFWRCKWKVYLSYLDETQLVNADVVREAEYVAASRFQFGRRPLAADDANRISIRRAFRKRSAIGDRFGWHGPKVGASRRCPGWSGRIGAAIVDLFDRRFLSRCRRCRRIAADEHHRRIGQTEQVAGFCTQQVLVVVWAAERRRRWVRGGSPLGNRRARPHRFCQILVVHRRKRVEAGGAGVQKAFRNGVMAVEREQGQLGNIGAAVAETTSRCNSSSNSFVTGLADLRARTGRHLWHQQRFLLSRQRRRTGCCCSGGVDGFVGRRFGMPRGQKVERLGFVRSNSGSGWRCRSRRRARGGGGGRRRRRSSRRRRIRRIGWKRRRGNNGGWKRWTGMDVLSPADHRSCRCRLLLLLLLTQTFETQVGHPMGQALQLGIVIRILQMMDHLLLLWLLRLHWLLWPRLLLLLRLMWLVGRLSLEQLLMLTTTNLLLLLLLLGLLASLRLRMTLAGRAVQQSLRWRSVKRGAVGVLHFRRGRRRREERESRITQPGHSAIDVVALLLLLKRLLLLLLDRTESIAASRWLSLSNVIYDGRTAGGYCRPSCMVGRVIGDEAVHHFGRHRWRCAGIIEGALVTGWGWRARGSRSPGRWTVVVPCITGVAGHQVATTVVRRQAEDLTLDEPLARRRPDGRRCAHDGWHSADDAAAAVAGTIEPGGIPESLKM